MNENQRKAVEILNKKFSKGEITLNNYRQSLDVCLAALEEPAQASEPTQTGLTGKLKNLVQVKKNKKDEAVHVPGVITPKDIEFNMFSPSKKQIDELYTHKTNLFMKEPDEKDEYDAAMAEWRESFNAWKEKDAEADERINEIADKVNKIYAVLNERVHPLVKRIDNDVHQVKKQTEASANKLKEPVIKNKTLDDYPLTDKQLQQVMQHIKMNQITDANEMLKQLKNDIAKEMKEQRLKGGLS